MNLRSSAMASATRASQSIGMVSRPGRRGSSVSVCGAPSRSLTGSVLTFPDISAPASKASRRTSATLELRTQRLLNGRLSLCDFGAGERRQQSNRFELAIPSDTTSRCRGPTWTQPELPNFDPDFETMLIMQGSHRAASFIGAHFGRSTTHWPTFATQSAKSSHRIGARSRH
jgi:hypothetical protein